MEFPQEVPFPGLFYIKSKLLPPAFLMASLSPKRCDQVDWLEVLFFFFFFFFQSPAGPLSLVCDCT